MITSAESETQSDSTNRKVLLIVQTLRGGGCAGVWVIIGVGYERLPRPHEIFMRQKRAKMHRLMAGR